jgi:hypothetical protein
MGQKEWTIKRLKKKVNRLLRKLKEARKLIDTYESEDAPFVSIPDREDD